MKNRRRKTEAVFPKTSTLGPLHSDLSLVYAHDAGQGARGRDSPKLSRQMRPQSSVMLFLNQKTLLLAKLPFDAKGLMNPRGRPTLVIGFSSVLGDIFHAMHHTRVPVKHEAKKCFFTRMNAFLVWNTEKLNKLEDNTRAEGMTEKDIENQRYYNRKLYTSCVDRYAPSHTILYWRVRAVYVPTATWSTVKQRHLCLMVRHGQRPIICSKKFCKGFT